MEQDRQTVLIVDDVSVTTQLLAALVGQDYNTIIANNGMTALAIAAEQQPDLILLDILMSDIDGYEVCRRLKANPETQAIPVIFITGLSREADEWRGLEVGGIDYITMPFSPPVVHARIRNHLELKRSRDRLAQLSALDGLTGIPNRRSFDETLNREWSRARRADKLLSLLMIDVDEFKAYNDTYGHAEGDTCLRRIAIALTQALSRSADALARYGGEEFACILPETPEQGAREVARHFQAAIAALAIPHANSGVGPHVTVSIGGATTRPATASTGLDLVIWADRHLYEAKRSGRNRIILSEMPSPLKQPKTQAP